MFFLVLTIISGSMLSIVMRLSEGKSTGKLSMLAANYLTCMLLAGMEIGFGNVISSADKSGLTLLMGITNGVIYMIALILMQYNIKKNGVVLSSVFSRLGGLLVPLTVSIGIFGEVPTIAQGIGSGIAILAIIMINYNKENAEAKAKAMLLLVFLSDGCAAAMSKIYGEVGDHNLKPHFLFFTFTSAFILCVILVLFRKEKTSRTDVLFGIGMGMPNFFASRFLLKSLETVPAVIAYPTRGVACIVVISLAGVLLFKERLTKVQWMAIGAILVAVVLLNI